jgi:hypothetical protein
MRARVECIDVGEHGPRKPWRYWALFRSVPGSEPELAANTPALSATFGIRFPEPGRVEVGRRYVLELRPEREGEG